MQQSIFRRTDPNRGDCAQPTGEVGQLNDPARGRRAGREQDGQTGFARCIQQVEQRGFVCHRIGCIDRDAGCGRQFGQAAQCGSGTHFGAGVRRPDVQQMGFAAAGFTPQQKPVVWPIGGSVEPGGRRGIRRCRAEIHGYKARFRGKGQGRLIRGAHWHTPDPRASPRQG